MKYKIGDYILSTHFESNGLFLIGKIVDIDNDSIPYWVNFKCNSSLFGDPYSVRENRIKRLADPFEIFRYEMKK